MGRGSIWATNGVILTDFGVIFFSLHSSSVCCRLGKLFGFAAYCVALILFRIRAHWALAVSLYAFDRL